MAGSSEDHATRLLRLAFHDVDSDGCGHIEAHDLRALFVKAGLSPTDAEIAEMIRQIDKNDDSKLSFEEVQDGLLKNPHLQSVLSLRGQFLSVDKNKTGTISLENHIDAIKAMGNPWNFSDDQMREVFNTMDVNNDGAVSFEELIKAYAVKPGP